MSPSPLADRHVLVTGGLSGIGRSIAGEMAAAGARLTVVDRADVSRDDDLAGADLVQQLGAGGRSFKRT